MGVYDGQREINTRQPMDHVLSLASLVGEMPPLGVSPSLGRRVTGRMGLMTH